MSISRTTPPPPLVFECCPLAILDIKMNYIARMSQKFLNFILDVMPLTCTNMISLLYGVCCDLAINQELLMKIYKYIPKLSNKCLQHHPLTHLSTKNCIIIIVYPRYDDFPRWCFFGSHLTPCTILVRWCTYRMVVTTVSHTVWIREGLKLNVRWCNNYCILLYNWPYLRLFPILQALSCHILFFCDCAVPLCQWKSYL